MSSYIFGGIAIAVAGVFIAMAFRAARKQGAAEALKDVESHARDVEQDMTEAMMADDSPKSAIDKMKKGDF
jgi:hypothetical protein